MRVGLSFYIGILKEKNRSSQNLEQQKGLNVRNILV